MNVLQVRAGGLTDDAPGIPTQHLTAGFRLPGVAADDAESPYDPNLSMELESTPFIAQVRAAGAAVIDAAVGAAVVEGRIRPIPPLLVAGAVAGGVAYAGYQGAQALYQHLFPAEPLAAQPLTGREQAILSTLAQTVHAQVDGSWGSTLDALTAVVAKGGEAMMEEAQALLQQDLGSTGVKEGAVAGARAKRSATPGSDTIIPDLGPVSVREVVAAVEHVQQRAQPSKEELLFDALQPLWSADPTMTWVERLPQSEQKLWATYVYDSRAADQAFSKALTSPQRLWLDRAQSYWAEQQLPGHPYQYDVSLNSSVSLGSLRVPITTNFPLPQASMVAAVPGLDLNTATVSLNDPITQQQSLTGAQQQSVLSFLHGSGAWPQLDEVVTDRTTQHEPLKTLYAQSLNLELHKDLLEAKAKGYLSGQGAPLNGASIVLDALRNDPSVQSGVLRLSTGSRPQDVTVDLTNWWVFERNETQGANNGVVLYLPETQSMGWFNTRQELFQHLDQTRLRQNLKASETGSLFQEQALMLAPPMSVPPWSGIFKRLKTSLDFLPLPIWYSSPTPAATFMSISNNGPVTD
ncbi:hypothetical protein [Pseudomonas sp. TH31]|uniref:hypothetical protein n=1 Tax=Pseudomonas sp. TH31 TaxID=2796396 RepID=UPI0019115BA0|nr:hypothetical protein [Pseudomonas sp. TH31]MBK5415431.1 hypothetical protein [Pseudomonas sp. TH31]